MLTPISTISPQLTANNTSTAANAIVTVTRSPGQQWAIEHIIASVDRAITPADNNIHLSINTDSLVANTFNTNILRWGVDENNFHTQFSPPLEIPKGQGVQVKLVDGGTVIENHVNVIYR